MRISKKHNNFIINRTPHILAMDVLKKRSPVTAEVINKILAFLPVKISISQNCLEELLRKPWIEFDDLSPDTIKSEKFLKYIGKVRDEKCNSGVYIWRHKSSGKMYVGSSTSLARRLIGQITNFLKDKLLFMR